MDEKIRNGILNAHFARNIDTIIVHCAATPEGKEFTAADIRRWHVDGNGWKDIGYHFVIKLDGTIEEGRPLSHIGSHCFGHNTSSIGICYIGGLDKTGKKAKDTRTVRQVAAMLALLKVLKQRWPKAKIYGHHDFDKSKACPSFDAKEEYKNL